MPSRLTWSDKLRVIIAGCRAGGLSRAETAEALAELVVWQSVERALEWVQFRHRQRQLRRESIEIAPGVWAV